MTESGCGFLKKWRPSSGFWAGGSPAFIYSLILFVPWRPQFIKQRLANGFDQHHGVVAACDQ